LPRIDSFFVFSTNRITGVKITAIFTQQSQQTIAPFSLNN
jgi:hypothetical protein